MKKFFAWGGMGILSLLLATQVWAVQFTQSADKMTIVVDRAFEVRLPDKKWDTQKVGKNPNAPLQWVFHQAGPNPRIKLKYLLGKGVKGKSLDQIAQTLKAEYHLQGVTIEKIQRKTINGQRALVLHGLNPYKDERFMIGVLVGTNKGYILECSSQLEDFFAMKSHFLKTIEQARILK